MAKITARGYHKNPRKITDAQLTRLGETLAELGDLGGIVHDLNSNELIGGNQRSKAFALSECEVEIIKTFDPPTAQGTTAHGFVVWRGERYAYRQVRWTPEQCERANIVANAAGGSWDWSILKSDFDPALLADAGLDADALAAMNQDAEGLRGLLFQTDDKIDPMQEWEGMPEHISEEIRNTAIECIVRFRCEDDRNAFEKLLGYKLQHKGKTYSVWYPKQDFNQLGRDMEFVVEF